MRDLRKKVLLESGKTTSRAARAKIGSSLSTPDGSPAASPAHSRSTSRVTSRAGSRNATDEEAESEGFESDDFLSQSTEMDEHNLGLGTEDWVSSIQLAMADLSDVKNTSAESRQTMLSHYIWLMRHYVASDGVGDCADDYIAILMRSVRATNQEERRLAVRALGITFITWPSEKYLFAASPPLKAACQDAEDDRTKVEALRVLGIIGAFEGSAEDLREYLLEIVESDGESVGAPDSGPVVVAAMKSWALVASFVDDISDEAEQAIEAFTEQLDSVDADVQATAGESIALVFEAVRLHEVVQNVQFDLQYNQHKTLTRMRAINQGASKSRSKKARRDVRSALTSVITSLEKGVGPGYSTALSGKSRGLVGSVDDLGSRETGPSAEYGYRERIRVVCGGVDCFLTVTTWALRTRLETLKVMAGGGFITHLMESPYLAGFVGEMDIEPVGDWREQNKSRKTKDRRGLRNGGADEY